MLSLFFFYGPGGGDFDVKLLLGLEAAEKSSEDAAIFRLKALTIACELVFIEDGFERLDFLIDLLL